MDSLDGLREREKSRPGRRQESRAAKEDEWEKLREQKIRERSNRGSGGPLSSSGAVVEFFYSHPHIVGLKVECRLQSSVISSKHPCT